jgi:hypothetical protein
VPASHGRFEQYSASCGISSWRRSIHLGVTRTSHYSHFFPPSRLPREALSDAPCHVVASFQQHRVVNFSETIPRPSTLSSSVHTHLVGVNMVLSLNYRRPAHVDSSRSSIGTEKSHGESVSSSSSCPYGIPEALSFEKIVSGATCPVSPAISHVSSVSRLTFPVACYHPRVYGLPSLH